MYIGVVGLCLPFRQKRKSGGIRHDIQKESHYGQEIADAVAVFGVSNMHEMDFSRKQLTVYGMLRRFMNVKLQRTVEGIDLIMIVSYDVRVLPESVQSMRLYSNVICKPWLTITLVLSRYSTAVNYYHVLT